MLEKNNIQMIEEIKVVIGIINKDDKILMIKRAKKEGELEWVFPGGKVEENETEEEACIREVFEETGIHVVVVDKIGERIHPNTNMNITYFLCKYVGGNIKILNYDEVLEIDFKGQEEIKRDIKTDIFPPVKKYIDKYIK